MTVDSEDQDISHISGNVPDEVKRFVGIPAIVFKSRVPEVSKPIFGESVTNRLLITEISVVPKAEEPKRLEGRVVCEITVEEDMLNGAGYIHGGCSAFLIDMCTTLCMLALSMTSSGELFPSVSQSLNVVYHSPAGLGDRLRLVNTTMTLGARAHSARTEIWNLTHRRLVSSGVHIKMQPSDPKTKL